MIIIFVKFDKKKIYNCQTFSWLFFKHFKKLQVFVIYIKLVPLIMVQPPIIEEKKKKTFVVSLTASQRIKYGICSDS